MEAAGFYHTKPQDPFLSKITIDVTKQSREWKRQVHFMSQLQDLNTQQRQMQNQRYIKNKIVPPKVIRMIKDQVEEVNTGRNSQNSRAGFRTAKFNSEVMKASSRYKSEMGKSGSNKDLMEIQQTPKMMQSRNSLASLDIQKDQDTIKKEISQRLLLVSRQDRVSQQSIQNLLRQSLNKEIHDPNHVSPDTKLPSEQLRVSLDWKTKIGGHMSLARGLRQQLKTVSNSQSEVQIRQEVESKRSHIILKPEKQIQLLKKLDQIQQQKASQSKIQGLEPRHDGKIRNYFNIGIKKNLEESNGGVPVSLTALNQNREFMIKHLVTPFSQQMFDKNAQRSKNMSRASIIPQSQNTLQAHERLMKDLNRQSIENMKQSFMDIQLSDRKKHLHQLYVSRGALTSGAIYDYRCLPQSARFKYHDDFTILVDEKVRKSRMEECFEKCINADFK